jgi:hypothetical protein
MVVVRDWSNSAHRPHRSRAATVRAERIRVVSCLEVQRRSYSRWRASCATRLMPKETIKA